MFGTADLQQLEDLGIPVAEVRRQIGIFAQPPPCIELDRCCRLGDGIRVVEGADLKAGREHYEEAARRGRLLKFVPASGAASRMFHSLLSMGNACDRVNRARVERQATLGNQEARELLVFMDGFERFAFCDSLSGAMAADGLDAAALVAQGEFSQILEYLLMPCGLDYAALAKGLLLFHRYPAGNRTALEEHLVEAAAYGRRADGVARLHLTVSSEHREAFSSLLERVRPVYEQRYDVRFEVDFSVQKRVTDTLAVDLENRPFRTADGRLLFRPGGHGALIENLNDLQGDIVFLQNVDNVQPDHLRGEVLEWKKVLTGHLVMIQQAVFKHLRTLSTKGALDQHALEEARRFAAQELCVELPAELHAASSSEQQAFLGRKLDRPIRVCGIVPNTGEPGGGPFWVRGADGAQTLQIVEGAQVDPASREQQAMYASSTHFNPVVMVCGVRNWQDRCFDLRRFVDPQAVFISRKSKDGRELKALERPGLWNGAMADWNTIFVEVPNITFTPVKTVNDLLRPEHQPRIRD